MTLGTYIRELRHRKRLSLRRAGSLIGISPTSLSFIEHEKLVPGEDTIVRIAEVLGGDSDTLLCLAGRIPKDVLDIVKGDPRMFAFLRWVRDNGVSTSALLGILNASPKKDNPRGPCGS